MKTVKNILIIYDYNYINGGGAQIAILTANLLAAKGYRVIYFSGVSRSEESQLSKNITQYSTGQSDILTNPSRLQAMTQGIWNKKAVTALRSILAGLDASETVVHLHGWVKALSPAVGKVLLKSGFAVVTTLHDYFAACPNGGFYNYQQEAICHLRPLSISCICTHCDARAYSHKAWRVARQFVQRDVAGIPGRLEHFILTSRFSEEVFAPYLPKQAKKYIISNPVNLPSVPQQMADTRSGRMLLAGRISREKGMHLACEACRITNTALTIIGEGDQKAVLQQQYPEVDFKGWMNAENVLQEMLRSTALIFPSICYETQGLAVLEALSAGLPVIASAGCAASEYIDGKNGLTFETNNITDLAEKINLLTADTQKTSEMGRYASTQYWQHPYTTEVYVSQLTGAYHTVLNSRPK